MANKKKPKRQNKPHGHFCWVCGEHKANEKFSGRGHATHMCKKCHALPVAERNKMVALRKISNMGFRYISEQEIKWLRKKMKAPDSEVREAASGVYNMKFSRHDQELSKITELKTPVLYAELDDEQKAEAQERLAELIDGFFVGTDYLPDDEDRDGILVQLCEEMSDTVNRWEPESFDPVKEYCDPRFNFEPDIGIDEQIDRMREILDAEAEEFDQYAEPEEPETPPQKELIPDDGLKAAYNEIVAEFIAAMKEDGTTLPTFMETLTVAETERLMIRRFHKTDLGALFAIMGKPEVMYAWEIGFNKSETRKWLNRQYTRYNKDGYGYYAVTLKNTGKLIGQAGLMKNDIYGEPVTEIGYIFDNSVWEQGYAIEAARACADLAFSRFRLAKLYATIRPENIASVRVAKKLGMQKIGEYAKTYKEKDMPHDIYMLQKA